MFTGQAYTSGQLSSFFYKVLFDVYCYLIFALQNRKHIQQAKHIHLETLILHGPLKNFSLPEVFVKNTRCFPLNLFKDSPSLV